MLRAILVAGLGFGDESKGACVDKLTREFPVDLIVRFNGGSQAAHHVVLENGTSHCFAQFGSGMLANNTVRTHLSRFMLVDPITMMNEAKSLSEKTPNVWQRTTVDPRCVIITPFHKRLNRLREKSRGEARHGSCGMGVGVARELQLKYGDEVLVAIDLKGSRDFALHMLLNTTERMKGELEELSGNEILWGDIRSECKQLVEQYSEWPAIMGHLEESECMVFEGAQGVLLDEKHGTAPHNTWTNTTFENADTLLDEVGCKDRFRIGCLRTYHTRHGAGPFPTEDNTLDLPELHNGTGEFQGAFRVGRFDAKSLKYALDVVGKVDSFSVSHLDYLSRLDITDNFVNDLEIFTGIPVAMKANGPTAAHRTLELGVYA